MAFEPMLCDFDGTLADSEPVIVEALRAACQELRVPIPEGGDLRRCVGPPLERSLPWVLGPHAPIQRVIDTYRCDYMKRAPTRTMLFPGALDAVEACAKHNIRVGVVSYKPLPLIQRLLDGTGLSVYVSVLRAPPLGRPPLSKTALLQSGLDELHPHRARPVFIGDHPDDERAARETSTDFIRHPAFSWPEIVQKVIGP